MSRPRLSLDRANAHIVAQDCCTVGGGAARAFVASSLRVSTPIPTGALSAGDLGGTPQISGWGSATSRVVFNRATERARGPQDAKGAAALPVLPVGLGLSGTMARWSPSGVLLACRCWQLAGEDLPDRQDYATPGKSVNLASRALEPCRCMPIIGCRSDSQAHLGLCSCDGPV